MVGDIMEVFLSQVLWQNILTGSYIQSGSFSWKKNNWKTIRIGF